jgi:hypothetical protein
MAHEHDRLTLALVPIEGVKALLLETRVTDCQHLIHDQQDGFGEDGDGECEADLHAGGEGLELLFREGPRARKREHFVDLLHSCAWVRPSMASLKKDVSRER